MNEETEGQRDEVMRPKSPAGEWQTADQAAWLQTPHPPHYPPPPLTRPFPECPSWIHGPSYHLLALQPLKFFELQVLGDCSPSTSLYPMSLKTEANPQNLNNAVDAPPNSLLQDGGPPSPEARGCGC